MYIVIVYCILYIISCYYIIYLLYNNFFKTTNFFQLPLYFSIWFPHSGGDLPCLPVGLLSGMGPVQGSSFFFQWLAKEQVKISSLSNTWASSPTKPSPAVVWAQIPFGIELLAPQEPFFSQEEAHPCEQNCWLVKASCLRSSDSLCLGCDCNWHRAVTVSAVTKTKPLMDGQGWAVTTAPEMDICSKGDVIPCLTRPK